MVQGNEFSSIGVARRTILVVDDDPIVLRAISQPLLHKGFEVTAVDSGESAIDWLCEHTPDLVILDIVMPGLSGHDVCRVVRAMPELAETPILYLTSKRGCADMAEANEAGSDLYLMKPIVPSRLVNMVEMFLSPEMPLQRRRPLSPPV